MKWPDPVESAKAVVAFEGRIAEAKLVRGEHRDAVKSFNPMSIGELTAFVLGIPMAGVSRGAQMPDVQRIVISEKLPRSQTSLKSSPMHLWRRSRRGVPSTLQTGRRLTFRAPLSPRALRSRQDARRAERRYCHAGSGES